MNKKSTDRSDGRNSKGRWKKGTCGNPNGRPRKVPDLDMADVFNFSQVPTELTVGGEKTMMSRHEVLLLKMYDSALKGRVTMQKYLLEKFEEATLRREILESWLQDRARCQAEDPDSVSPDVVRLMGEVLSARDRPRTHLRTKTPAKRKGGE